MKISTKNLGHSEIFGPKIGHQGKLIFVFSGFLNANKNEQDQVQNKKCFPASLTRINYLLLTGGTFVNFRQFATVDQELKSSIVEVCLNCLCA